MKKLLSLVLLAGFIVASSLQAMNTTNNQPNVGVPTTHDAFTGFQETNAAATAPQFKFHFGTPSLQDMAAANITTEEAEEAYQEQLALQARIQEVEKAGDSIKVAELEKQRKFIPWILLEKTQQIPKDATEKNINALKKDNLDLLKMAMEKRKIDSKTKTPLLEAVSLDHFRMLATKAVKLNAPKSLNFLLSHAENIPLQTLNELLTYDDSELASAEVLQLLINRVMEDTNHKPHGQFFDTWNQFPLHKAIIENRALEIAKLIDDKADVNMVAHDMTPLLLTGKYSTGETSYKISKLLIENGADVNAQDNKKRTPLMYASRNDNTAVAQLLIAKGAKVKARDWYHFNPLMYAIQDGHTAIVQLLIEKGAKINAQDSYGRTPLMYASQAGHAAVVQLLIENGAKINAQDSYGRTPLIYASRNGHTAVAQLLIKNSAEVNVKNKEGDTPLHLATKYIHPAIVKILLDAGADVAITDHHERTALQIAVESGYKEIVDILKPKFATITNTVDDESDSEDE